MIEVDNIVVDYGGTWTLRANCRFAPGTWTSLVGPSGSGKTTLAQAIAGFVPLRSGHIRCNQVNISTLPPSKRGLGYVFQHDNLFEHLTVEQNLLLATHDDPAPKAQRLDRIVHILKRVGLQSWALHKKPTQLSGGEKARVAVARALIRGHKWLILDEAFAALDEPLRLSIQAWLESLLLADDNLGIISLTHQLRDAHLFSDRIIALESGQIVFDGKTGDLVPPPLNRPAELERARQHLAALDERWSWLDGNAATALGFPRLAAVALAPGEWRMCEAGQQTTSQPDWLETQLMRPRWVDSGSGMLLRDRGTRTLLKVPEDSHARSGSLATVTIAVRKQALTTE